MAVPYGSAAGGRAPARALRLHHIAIQTLDLENCQAWYRAFLGCKVAWSLDRFSPLTERRLPGIRALIELVVGDVRLHVFERAAAPARPATGAAAAPVQHVCLAVETRAELERQRARWLALFHSGRYRFALPDPPTEIAVDADGVACFYAHDPDGLELELAYVPEARS